MTIQALTVPEQIKFLAARNVSFNIVAKKEASDYLTKNTYFFKLKSYLNNYKKHGSGSGYEPSEFAYLQELSKIDFSLSRLVLSLTTNVEHAMKIRLNNELMTAGDPSLADQCVAHLLTSFDIRRNQYTQRVYDSCHGKYYMWDLWELLGFRDQIELYLGYQRRAHTSDREEQLWNEEASMLYSTRKMRNAAAHGNCLLADVAKDLPSVQKGNRPNTSIYNRAMLMCNKQQQDKNRGHNLQTQLYKLVVSNFAGVLVTHRAFVKSQPIIDHTVDRLTEFRDRINRNKTQYFGKSNGRKHPRNRAINDSLNALAELCQGYIEHA